MIVLNLYNQWSKLFGIENFHETKKLLHYYIKDINEQFWQQKDKQYWAHSHFANQTSLIRVFEQIYVIRKNIEKQCPDFFPVNLEKKEFKYERFQMTMFMAFFPNLLKLVKDVSPYHKKERSFIEKYLGLNYEACIKVENLKWSQTLKTLKNSHSEESIKNYKKKYQSLLENFLQRNFPN